MTLGELKYVIDLMIKEDPQNEGLNVCIPNGADGFLLKSVDVYGTVGGDVEFIIVPKFKMRTKDDNN